MPEEKELGEVEVLFSRGDCPECGSTRGVYRETVEQEVAAGRFSREMADMGIGECVPGLVIDPTKRVLTAPQVTIIYDYCLACGERYVTKIIRVRVQVTVQAQPGQRPGGGMPNSGSFRSPRR